MQLRSQYNGLACLNSKWQSSVPKGLWKFGCDFVQGLQSIRTLWLRLISRQKKRRIISPTERRTKHFKPTNQQHLC